MTLLGNAKLTDADLEPWTAPAKDIDDDDDMQEIDGDITATGITPPTQLSQASQRDHTIRQEPIEEIAGDLNMDVPDEELREPSPPVVEQPQQRMELVEENAQVAVPLPNGELDQAQIVPTSASTATGTRSEGIPEPDPVMEEGIPLADTRPAEKGNDDWVDASMPLDAEPLQENEDQPDVGMAGDDEGGPVDLAIPEAEEVSMPVAEEAVNPEEEDAMPLDPADQAVPLTSNAPIQVVVEPATSPISDPPAEEETVAAATTQLKGKGKASAKTTKKSRSAAAPTTQTTKRRRLSTPEKSEVEVPEVPAFEGRVRRQAASKAADMLHNVIAPDMALHEKEKKRKDIVSPKSRRAARVGGSEEGSSRKAKQASVSEDEQATDDEVETKLQAKSTQRGGKKAAASTRGRSRSTVVRDTARSQLTTRSASVLSALSGEEEDREGDLVPSQIRLMCTGYNLDDKTSKVGLADSRSNHD